MVQRNPNRCQPGTCPHGNVLRIAANCDRNIVISPDIAVYNQMRLCFSVKADTFIVFVLIAYKLLPRNIKADQIVRIVLPESCCRRSVLLIVLPIERIHPIDGIFIREININRIFHGSDRLDLKFRFVYGISVHIIPVAFAVGIVFEIPGLPVRRYLQFMIGKLAKCNIGEYDARTGRCARSAEHELRIACACIKGIETHPFPGIIHIEQRHHIIHANDAHVQSVCGIECRSDCTAHGGARHIVPLSVVCFIACSRFIIAADMNIIRC